MWKGEHCIAWLCVVLIVSLLPFSLYGRVIAYPNLIFVHLDSNPYTKSNKGLYDEIEMNGFLTTALPGEPLLPSKDYKILVPIQAISAEITVTNYNLKTIKGKYNIGLAMPLSNGKISSISNNKVSNRPVIENLGIHQKGAAKFLLIRFSPFTYNKDSKELKLYNSISLRITFQTSSDDFKNPYLVNKEESLFLNGKSAENLGYKVISQSSSASSYDYVVVTTDAIDVSEALSSFISFKQFEGYSLKVVTIEYIQNHFSGRDTPEKIRNFLKANYNKWGIKYVLFIGNPYDSSNATTTSTGGSVPMRYCYPDPGNHTVSADPNSDGRIPTDYYYADLTGNWDSDGDGYFGEYGQDNVDFYPEVYVGRIPFDDPNIVKKVLNKSITFEKERHSLKNKVLLIGAISNFENENGSGYKKTDGAVLMEKMWSDFLNNAGFSRTTLYEKDGLDSSSYNCDLPLNKSNVVSEIMNNAFGVVAWHAHGWMNWACRKIWISDNNDDGIPQSSEMDWKAVITNTDASSSFSTTDPAIYFSASCLNSYPDLSNGESLSEDLLKTKAVDIVGANRVSWYTIGWNNPSDGGNQSIEYYFLKNLVNGSSSGKALYGALEYYYENFNFSDWKWYPWANLFDFSSLYGDPTVGLSNVVFPPSVPQSLTATANSSSITLAWQPSTSGTYPIAGYAIHRGTASGGESTVPIVATDVYATTYTNINVTQGTTYYYYVKAFDNQNPPNYSAPSNEVSAVVIGTSSSFTLHLPSGWSIISVPFQTTASALNCDHVLAWNTDLSKWDLIGSTDILQPGIGYVVDSSQPQDITLTGTPTSSPFTEPATGTWQIIGNPFTVSCTLSSSDTTILHILAWNTNLNKWDLISTSDNTAQLQPGVGYVILTSSSGTLTFTKNNNNP